MRTSSPKILYKIYQHLKLTKISLLYIRFSKSLTTDSQNPLQPFFKSFCYRYIWLLKSKRGLLGKFQVNVHFYMLSIKTFKKFGSSHWRVLLKITHFAFFLGGPISASIPHIMDVVVEIFLIWRFFLISGKTFQLIFMNSLPYKHTTCIPHWNDVDTVVSTLFQRGIHVVCLSGICYHYFRVSCFISDHDEIFVFSKKKTKSPQDLNSYVRFILNYGSNQRLIFKNKLLL